MRIDFERDLKELIKIEDEKEKITRITLSYSKYLREHLKLYQRGRKKALEDVEKMIDERLSLMGSQWEMYNAIEILNDIKNRQLQELKKENKENGRI